LTDIIERAWPNRTGSRNDRHCHDADSLLGLKETSFHFNELIDPVNEKILAAKAQAQERDCTKRPEGSMDLLPHQYVP
jgi:hypothetical protein